MPFCPNCRAEYVEGVKRCVDCDVELVPELEPEEGERFSNEPFIPVFRYKDDMEAAIARGVLEDAGIPVWERADVVKSVHRLTVGPLGEEVLLVPESRTGEALKALEEALGEGADIEDDADPA